MFLNTYFTQKWTHHSFWTKEGSVLLGSTRSPHRKIPRESSFALTVEGKSEAHLILMSLGTSAPDIVCA